MAPANTIPAIDLSLLRRGSEGDKREVSRAIDAALTEIGFFMRSSGEPDLPVAGRHRWRRSRTPLRRSHR